MSLPGHTVRFQILSLFAVVVLGFSLAAEAVTLTAVQSRKTHGGAGPRELQIDLTQGIGGAITVEPRAIGAGHLIVFQFDGPVTSTGPVASVNDLGEFVGTASIALAGSEAQVTLTGVPDNSRLTVQLLRVNATDGDAFASVAFLVGDVNNSRAVAPTDLLQMKGRAGQAVDASNFPFDLNASGIVTASDILGVKAHSGLTVPASTGNSVFVAKSGNDLNFGSRLQPKLTVNAGLTTAAAMHGGTVYVAVGNYAETGGAMLRGGVAVRGGYDSQSWLPAAVGTTTITGSPQAAFADGTVGVTLQGLTLTGTPDAGNLSAYGLRAVNGASLILNAVTVNAGNAMPGAAGAAVPQAPNGGNGTAGSPGSCDGNNGLGGPGGSSVTGRTGGGGGAGGAEGSNPGANGLPSSSGNLGGNGGAGCNAGISGSCAGSPGANASPGTTGVAGGAGSGGTNSLTAAGEMWAGMNGGAGIAGGPGTGGGGGGGGGGQGGFSVDDGGGNGGGGGGGAGAGGASGNGGGFAGGSFGVYLFNANVTINASVITSGFGGSGGAGSAEGAGGLGGIRGSGGTACAGEVGRGGNGGDGGAGGAGGAGGGGAGGPSAGVFRGGTSTVNLLGGTLINPGTGGPGGTSNAGVPGNGAAGQSGSVLP